MQQNDLWSKMRQFRGLKPTQSKMNMNRLMDCWSRSFSYGYFCWEILRTLSRTPWVNVRRKQQHKMAAFRSFFQFLLTKIPQISNYLRVFVFRTFNSHNVLLFLLFSIPICTQNHLSKRGFSTRTASFSLRAETHAKQCIILK